MNATVSPAVRLKIQGMDCGSCALTIEQAVRAVPGIASVRVDFTTETLEATGSATRDQIEARGVKDPAVLDAMRRVPRHRFVPPASRASASASR